MTTAQRLVALICGVLAVAVVVGSVASLYAAAWAWLRRRRERQEIERDLASRVIRYYPERMQRGPFYTRNPSDAARD